MSLCEEHGIAPVVAAFDFDGTITRGDSLLPFLRFAAGWPGFLLGLAASVPMLVGLASGLVPAQTAKETLIRRFLRDRTKAEMAAVGEAFAENVIPRMLRPSAIARLTQHQQLGHHCVLVSASLDCYLEPWAVALGFDDVLCSRLEFDEQQRVTGRLQGHNCKGAEKVRRLQEYFGVGWPIAEMFAYGDSSGDRELLAAASRPFFREFRD